jgi:FtsZ-binding cell division protein ZapB
MEVKKICSGVGHDGTSFFCWNCGKAGYATKESAIGHQAKCSARHVKNEVPRSSAPSSLGTSLGTSVARIELGSSLGTELDNLPQETSNAEHQLAVLVKQIEELKQTQVSLSNEIPHLLGINSNVWVFILIGAYVVYKMGQDSTCRCDVEGTSRRKSGSSIQDKITDKAINYGIGKLFK